MLASLPQRLGDRARLGPGIAMLLSQCVKLHLGKRMIMFPKCRKLCDVTVYAPEGEMGLVAILAVLGPVTIGFYSYAIYHST